MSWPGIETRLPASNADTTKELLASHIPINLTIWDLYSMLLLNSMAQKSGFLPPSNLSPARPPSGPHGLCGFALVASLLTIRCLCREGFL
jgi:hypothetical protein